jgi:hypothetical protein
MSTLSNIAKIGSAAGLAMYPEESDATFISATAKAADEMMFHMAKRMRASGMTPEDVFEKTGFFKAADGNWKYEVPDTDVKIKDSYIDDGDRLGLKSSEFVRVDRAVDHPELYKSQDGVGDAWLSVHPEGTPIQNRGYYNPSQDLIRVNNELPLDAKLKTLMHEVQHKIQDLEGWQSGGNKGMFDLSLSNSYFEASRKKFEKIMELDTRIQKLGDDYWTAKQIGDTDLANDLRKQYDGARRRREALTDRRQEDVEMMDNTTPFALYERLMGEVEARNVADRYQLTKAYEKQGLSPTQTLRKQYPGDDKIQGTQDRDPKWFMHDPEEAGNAYKYSARNQGNSSYDWLNAPGTKGMSERFSRMMDAPAQITLGTIAHLAGDDQKALQFMRQDPWDSGQDVADIINKPDTGIFKPIQGRTAELAKWLVRLGL